MRTQVIDMDHYDFTLKFELGQRDADPESLLECLMNEGCDDAIVGIGKPGRIALNFTREAESAEAAVLTALSDVKRAIPDANFIEATPDFVGATDIANLLGFTRQNMAKILQASGPDFPSPVHGGNRPIWHLETVLTWFMTHDNRKVDQALIEISRVNMRCNFAKEESRLARETPDQLRSAVA